MTEVIVNLAKIYPKVEFFNSNLYRKFINLREDSSGDNSSGGVD
jgi:hypothetical protein